MASPNGQHPFPTKPVTPKLERELDQVYREIKAGDISRPYTNLDDLLNDLNKLLP